MLQSRKKLQHCCPESFVPDSAMLKFSNNKMEKTFTQKNLKRQYANVERMSGMHTRYFTIKYKEGHSQQYFEKVER